MAAVCCGSARHGAAAASNCAEVASSCQHRDCYLSPLSIHTHTHLTCTHTRLNAHALCIGCKIHTRHAHLSWWPVVLSVANNRAPFDSSPFKPQASLGVIPTSVWDTTYIVFVYHAQHAYDVENTVRSCPLVLLCDAPEMFASSRLTMMMLVMYTHSCTAP